MSYTYSKIASVTVGSTSVSSFDFLAIPQNYTDLLIKISMRGTNATVYAAIAMTFNSDNGSNYSRKYLEASGASAYSGGDTNGVYINVGNFNGSTATANAFGTGEIYIPNYTGSNYKSVSIETVNETNATTAYMDLVGGIWQSSAPINSIKLTIGGSGSAVQYSTATLYGIKAEV